MARRKTLPILLKRTSNPSASTAARELAAIDSALQSVEKIKSDLAGVLRQLMSTTQRRRLLRGRVAAKGVIQEILPLVADHPNLAPNGVAPESIQGKADLLAATYHLRDVLAGLHNAVDDTARLMEVELYKIGLGIYTIGRVGTPPSDITAALDKMEKAMKVGNRYPRRKVETLPKRVTLRVPADAVEAVKAAADKAMKEEAGRDEPPEDGSPGA